MNTTRHGVKQIVISVYLNNANQVNEYFSVCFLIEKYYILILHMTRRWHATTFNEQFETFGNTVSEYSFELTRDEMHTCGALVLHNGVRGPTTGKTWGRLFLFPNTTIREHELAQSVDRRHFSHVRRFVLRNPLKSKTLPSGVQQLYVLKPTETKKYPKAKANNATHYVKKRQHTQKVNMHYM